MEYRSGPKGHSPSHATSSGGASPIPNREGSWNEAIWPTCSMVGKCRAMTTALLLTRSGRVLSCRSSIRNLPKGVIAFFRLVSSWCCSPSTNRGPRLAQREYFMARFLEWGDDRGGSRSLQARQAGRIGAPSQSCCDAVTSVGRVLRARVVAWLPISTDLASRPAWVAGGCAPARSCAGPPPATGQRGQRASTHPGACARSR